jgi:ArsR family transcriptional regulator
MTQTAPDSLNCTARCVHPDAVGAARARLADREGDLDGARALFAALGDPTRLRLLAALQAGPLCTCDLAATLGVTESAVSHLLRALRLVASRRDGRVVYHRLDDDHVATLLDVADEHVAEVSVESVESETLAADTPSDLDA